MHEGVVCNSESDLASLEEFLQKVQDFAFFDVKRFSAMMSDGLGALDFIVQEMKQVLVKTVFQAPNQMFQVN